MHHNGMKIALEVAKHVDKVRINPGLFVFDKPDPNRTEFTPDEVAAIGERITETFEPLVRSLKEQDKALRIGVNHGSLAERMLFSYGDTPLGMVESALEFIRICDRLDFHNIVISMKASRAPVMLAAYRLMAHRMDAEGFNYPLHLGVTEAGDGDYGRIKSTAGIATLLADGLGDTIRVSLTEAPEKEIPVCYGILQSLGLRKTMVEYVACPSCGRTEAFCNSSSATCTSSRRSATTTFVIDLFNTLINIIINFRIYFVNRSREFRSSGIRNNTK